MLSIYLSIYPIQSSKIASFIQVFLTISNGNGLFKVQPPTQVFTFDSHSIAVKRVWNEISFEKIEDGEMDAELSPQYGSVLNGKYTPAYDFKFNISFVEVNNNGQLTSIISGRLPGNNTVLQRFQLH